MPSPTQSGIDLIKSFEGYRNAAYPDPIHGWAVPTIGYGTTVYANGKKVAKGDTLTVLQAESELKAFVQSHITPALIKLPFFKDMTEPMLGALESFAYNLGPGCFTAPSGFETLQRRLREKDWKNMRSALMLYVNPHDPNVTEGLKRRRAAEASLWESGLTKISIPVMPSHPPVPVAPNGLKPGYLTANFTLSELVVSETAARQGLNNTPGSAEQANLKRLCETCLQPLREKLGQPVVVTSGYRGPAVNAAVGGSTTSAHMFGGAADIHVPGMTNQALMKFIHDMKLPVDQVIEEFGSWVHVGISQPGKPLRGQYLIARMVGGSAVYSNASF